MTAFTKENLVKDGDCVFYSPDGNAYSDNARFVARFKHMKHVNMGPFMTFLRRNFTVEEWFALIDGGMSPLPAAETKGYVAQHIKHWLRRDGFPETPEGFKQWMERQAKLRRSSHHASESINPGRQLQ